MKRDILWMLIDIFLWCWAHLPVLCLNDDRYFGFLCRDSFRDGKLRLSLINFMLGTRALYIITYNFFESKFEILHYSKIEDSDPEYLQYEITDRYVRQYINHLASVKDKDLLIEKEKLKRLYEIEQKRKDNFLQKSNIYTAVLIALIPLFQFMITRYSLDRNSLLDYSLYFVYVYVLINVCTLLFHSIRGNNICRSRFQDLKNALLKETEIAVQSYFDWRRIRCESAIFANYIDNIQKWGVCLLFFTIVMVQNAAVGQNKIVTNFMHIDQGCVVTLCISEISQPYTYSSVKWKEIVLNIDRKECKEIILISNSDITSYLSQLRRYLDLEIHNYKDRDLPKDVCKIILKGDDKDEKAHFKSSVK